MSKVNEVCKSIMLYYHLTSKIIIYSERSKRYQKKNKISAMLAQILLFNSCTNLINYLKNIIFSHDFLAIYRKSTKHSFQTQKIPFYNLSFFLIDRIKGSCREELYKNFQAIKGFIKVAKRIVSKVVFAKARVIMDA